MNQNTPPRRPQPTRPQQPSQQQRRPAQNGLGQPVRRPAAQNGQPRPAAPRPSAPQRPLIHPARAKRRRRQRTVILSIFVVIILVVCILIGLIFSELAVAIGTLIDRTGKDKPQDPATTTTEAITGTDDPVIGGTDAPVSDMKMTTLAMTDKDIATGNLLLISPEHAYVFPSHTSNLVNVFDNRPYITLENGTKTRVYKVRNSNQMLDKIALQALNSMIEAFYEQYKVTDMLVTWSHRTMQEQQDLYNLYVADYPGYTDAQIEQLLKSQVDTAGYSEHHLGTVVDLKLYSDEGVTYTLDDEPGYFAWLKQNCWKYGYILRYPAEKTEVTGISYEPYHFRYVEIPHAYYIMSNGLCFEEYLEQLRTTTSPDGEHLTVSVDGGATYEVYYVAASGDSTDVPVPAEYPYTVSGDNLNGFIVTVTMD